MMSTGLMLKTILPDYLLDVQDVIDQPHQPLRVAGRCPPACLPARGWPQGTGAQQPERPYYGSQRGPQFMADHGDEFVLHLVHFFAVGNVFQGHQHTVPAVDHRLRAY